jgi:hypothetical protein
VKQCRFLSLALGGGGGHVRCAAAAAQYGGHPLDSDSGAAFHGLSFGAVVVLVRFLLLLRWPCLRRQLYLSRVASLTHHPQDLLGPAPSLDPRLNALVHAHAGLSVALHSVAPTLTAPASSSLLSWATFTPDARAPSSASQTWGGPGPGAPKITGSVVSAGSDGDGYPAPSGLPHGAPPPLPSGGARPTKAVKESLVLLGSNPAPDFAMLMHRRAMTVGQIQGMQAFHDGDRTGSRRSGKSFAVVMRSWLLDRFVTAAADAASGHHQHVHQAPAFGLGPSAVGGPMAGSGSRSGGERTGSAPNAPSMMTSPVWPPHVATVALTSLSGAAPNPERDSDDDRDDDAESLPSESFGESSPDQSEDEGGGGSRRAPIGGQPVPPAMSFPILAGVDGDVAGPAATASSVEDAVASDASLPPGAGSGSGAAAGAGARAGAEVTTHASGMSGGDSSGESVSSREGKGSPRGSTRGSTRGSVSGQGGVAGGAPGDRWDDRLSQRSNEAQHRPRVLLFSAVGHLSVALHRFAVRIRARMSSHQQEDACTLLYQASAFLLWARENESMLPANVSSWHVHCRLVHCVLAVFARVSFPSGAPHLTPLFDSRGRTGQRLRVWAPAASLRIPRPKC